MPLMQTFHKITPRLSAVGSYFYNRYPRRFLPRRSDRIYILPTRDGLIYVILLALILLMAMVEHLRPTYFVLAVAAGILFAGLIFTNDNLSKLRIRVIGCRSGHVGEQARIVLQIENSAGRTRYHLKLAMPCDDRQQAFVTGTISRLKPSAAATIELALPLSERGRYKVLRVRLSTTFPFGLFRSWSWRPIDLVYFAYPRPQGALPLPMAGALHRENINRDDRSEESLGADFSGHKAYEFGDSLRHVNWRLVARGYDPQVKIFSGGGFPLVRIDLDRLTNTGDLEQRLSQAAKWIQVCRRNRLALKIRLSPNEPYASVTSANELRACLERLAVWKKRGA